MTGGRSRPWAGWAKVASQSFMLPGVGTEASKVVIVQLVSHFIPSASKCLFSLNQREPRSSCLAGWPVVGEKCRYSVHPLKTRMYSTVTKVNPQETASFAKILDSRSAELNSHTYNKKTRISVASTFGRAKIGRARSSAVPPQQ